MKKRIFIPTFLIILVSSYCAAWADTPLRSTLVPFTELIPQQGFLSQTAPDNTAPAHQALNWLRSDIQFTKGVLRLNLLNWGHSKLKICILGEKAIDHFSLELKKCFLEYKIAF